MAARWRLVLPSPAGPLYKPYRSEAAVRTAVDDERKTTTADRIIIQKWQNGSWGEWLRWVRRNDAWHAE